MRRMTGFMVLMVAAAGLTGRWTAEANAADFTLPDQVMFNRDIRPILSDKCFTCHGPDESTREAKLRLDVKAAAFADRDGVPALVAGEPGFSELYLRITSDDKKERMPPAKLAKQLTPREIALIKKWIQQGAKWQGHWAYIPPKRPATPNVKHKGWVANPIDAFLLARMERQGAAPSKPADRRTLLRRLSFDLIGLPPTSEEVERFVNDKSPNAYEKVVDRLLASKHYGERMAVYWLDLVRYADSIGYHSDTPREVWMYRDYVIKAFNENYRYDRFTREQVAGDLLPNATNEQKIASGYNRLLQTTEEGGAQAKEYMAKYAADRVRSIGDVWMSTSTGCAECHDHKYDPFTQKDFYSLAAFFADVNEPGVGKRQHTAIPTPQFEEKLKAFDAQIASVEKELVEASKNLTADQAKWEADLLQKLAKNDNTDFTWLDDQTVPNGQKNGAFNYITKEQGPVFSGAQSRKQSSGGNVQHFVINAKNTLKIEEGSTLFTYIYLDPKNPPQQIMLQFNDGSWEHRAWWGQDKIPYGRIGSDAANHRNKGALPEKGKWVRLEVSPKEVGLKPGSQLNGIAFTQWGGTAYWDKAGLNRNGIDLPQHLVKVLQTPSEKRNKKDADALAKHFASQSPKLKPLQARIASLKKQKADTAKRAPKTLITLTMKPRTMRILPRGNWLDDSGKVVDPTTPESLLPLGVKDRRASRLDLANWLMRKEHPLVARTLVNRLWKLYFGYGIARTVIDFGGQGEWPTHPELLDWLAVEFVDSGWDVKHMVKLIVMSNAYQQSSVPSEALAKADPYNRLYARQSRFRIGAEFVRDNALALSGLLSTEIGGPSVKPYQPAGYWQHMNFPRRSWKKDSGSAIYRRGLYMHWQRSFLHPSLLAFDAPTREECTAERPRSNIPQQALVLLNDPTYVEAARVFATSVHDTAGKDVRAGIVFAFRKTLQRKPNEPEIHILKSLYERNHKKYEADPAAATALMGVGDWPAPDKQKHVGVAAWMSVTRTVMNLHETITRQ